MSAAIAREKSIEQMTLTEAKVALWNKVRAASTRGAHHLYMNVFDLVREKYGLDWSEKYPGVHLPPEVLTSARILLSYIKKREEEPALVDYLVTCTREKRTELILLPFAPAKDMCPICTASVGNTSGSCQAIFERL